MRFRLRKDSVSGLVKILDKDLQHHTRRGLPLTMQQVLIALRLHATGTFQMVIGDLFGVYVFAACRVIHKVSRAIAKQNGNSCQSQRTWLISTESFMMLSTFQVWSGPSIVPTSEDHMSKQRKCYGIC